MKKIAMCYVMALMGIMSQAYEVKGLVYNTVADEPEAFATMRVYAADDLVRAVKSLLSDEAGAFAFDLADGQYVLKVSATGAATAAVDFAVAGADVDLGKVDLVASENQLAEVMVTAQRPMVTREIDRIGYDVQADEESKTSPVIEILKKVPLVLVQPDGTILVNGSSNYKIYRNGRPNASYSKNAKELFKSIPASTIKKIEVITDPGAREDAEGAGAILNIVTMENTSMKGIAGTANLGMSSIEAVPRQGGVFFTTQIDKFTISPYLGIFHSKKGTESKTFTENRYEATGDIYRENADSKGKITGFYWGFDSSLELDTLNLITVEYSGNRYDYSSTVTDDAAMTTSDGAPVYSYRTITSIPAYANEYHTMAANYQRSTRLKGETITLSYMLELGRSHQHTSSTYLDGINMPVAYEGVDNNGRSNSSEHTLQLDWSRPYGEIHKLDLGAKYIYRNSHALTDIIYKGLDGSNTDFKHTTNIGAAYADYRVKLGNFSGRAGARYEFSRMGGEYITGDKSKYHSDFNNVVPNVALSYGINDANQLKLSYSMRISRPDIDNLNPAVVNSPQSVSMGDPNLASATYNSFSLNYSLTKPKISADFTASASMSNDGIVPIQYTEGNILYSTYGNVGRTRSFSGNGYVQWMPGEKTQVMLNGSAQYNHYRNPVLGDNAFVTNSGWSGYAFLQLNQRLPWGLRGTVNLSYWSGYIGGVYSKMRAAGWSSFDHTLSLQKSFLKEDRLTLRLSARNPFGPYRAKYKTTTFNSGIDGMTLTTQRYNSMVDLGISYRFGSLQAYVKKTKGITNDDVEKSDNTPGSARK